jgi:hypothetical protein
MSSTRKALLAIEAGICFFPAVAVMFMTAIGFVTMFTIGAAEDDWEPRLEAASFLLIGGAGLIGAMSMLLYVLGGRRTISGRLVLVCCASGLLISGWSALDAFRSDAPLLFVLPGGAPFICGVHLMYLGRSYFTRVAID